MKLMKKTFLILVLLCSLVSTTKHIQAQIVYEPETLSINGAPKHDFLGLTVDKYLGLYWTCKHGNFFQLDISPAAPRIAGHLDRIVFYNTKTSTFNSIEVSNVYTHSDKRAKRNITPITGALNTVQALNPVSFQWKERIATRGSSSAEEDESSSDADRIQLGFIAQDVEEILPDAVLTDEEGHKLINYNAIIPLLVRSVQELKTQVDEQKDLIETLSQRDPLRLSNSNRINKLLNCVPNPSNGIVEVTYTLSEGYGDAYILVSDLSGNKETEIRSLSSGKNKLQTDLSTLSKGIHLITLVVDDGPMNSLRLVLN